ncbi:TIGR02391 family protein [Streptomyces uncialis]|uniref:TIGR02391 family protein n=1 Tax=Streptomyces uncialis TaxID=1048205 RepID=UPI0037B7518F
MDAFRNPHYLRETAAAVTEFKDALQGFLALHVETPDGLGLRGIAPPVTPAPGVTADEIKAAASRVARAAGRACAAPELTHMYIRVKGHPKPVDPIAAWRTIAMPKPILEPDDVLDAVEQILGRLEAMVLKAEAELPPTTGVEAMHPIVWGAAKRLWLDGHFRLAVQSAAESLTAQVRIRIGATGMDATNLYEKAFSKGSPLLRWPGDQSDRTVSSMNHGLAKYAPGVNMTIRNTAAHGNTDLTAQAALERLAALSLLARWIDECEDVT